MENAAKALEIAAGVLLGVLLLSLIAYFFSIIGEWPQAEEENISAEQLAKFNLEYEVYEKKAMYGVDVISCLNKAISNNEKYIEGEGFLIGTKYENKYFVDVCIRITNKVLEENLVIYYLDKNDIKGNYEEKIRDTNSSKTLKTINDDLGGKTGYPFPESLNSNDYYTKFTVNSELKSQNNTLEGDDYFATGDVGHVIGPNEKKYYGLSNASDKDKIIKLVNFSSESPKLTFKNTNADTLTDWSTLEWSTALYDFKTRRFCCDRIEYDESTGRVNKIYFSEIKKNNP